MSKWYIALIVCVLAGCSSKPTLLNYYTLHDPQTHSKTAPLSKSVKQVEMARVKLPDYLKQRNLAFLLSDTQLHFAPQHVWAEPLYDGVYQSLGKSLMRNHGIYATPNMKYDADETSLKVRIQIDDFISSYDGQVVLSGQYWVDHNGEESVYLFYFTLPLEEDGYPHTVRKMRAALTLLAADVASNLPV